jgi:hypothetical protein
MIKNMEVLSIFSSNSELVNLFDDFMANYDLVKLSSKDADTKYYTKPNLDRNEIYFHYLINNIKDEFSYNYSEDEQKEILDYFEASDFYLFDIQYKDELFLNNLILDFQNYLKYINEYDKQKILINHNKMGIVPLQYINFTVG